MPTPWAGACPHATSGGLVPFNQTRKQGSGRGRNAEVGALPSGGGATYRSKVGERGMLDEGGTRQLWTDHLLNQEPGSLDLTQVFGVSDVRAQLRSQRLHRRLRCQTAPGEQRSVRARLPQIHRVADLHVRGERRNFPLSAGLLRKLTPQVPLARLCLKDPSPVGGHDSKLYRCSARPCARRDMDRARRTGHPNPNALSRMTIAREQLAALAIVRGGRGAGDFESWLPTSGCRARARYGKGAS